MKSKPGAPIVLLYTDASERLGVGAWACVAFRPDKRGPSTPGPHFEASGVLRDSKNSSDLCEFMAVMNGLHAAHRAGIIRAGDHVVIRTDNKSAVLRINSLSAKRKAASVVGWLRKFVDEVGVTVAGKHMHGHQPADSPNPHVIYNRRCDQLCRHIHKPPKMPNGKPMRPRFRTLAEAVAAIVPRQVAP